MITNEVEGEDLDAWFIANGQRMELAYLQGVTPWERSGVGLRRTRSSEYWRAVRQPVAEIINSSGSVLDIGCANGYLLECLQLWLSEKQVIIEPFGLDISAALLEEAKRRLPFATFYHSNVWGWKAPRTYDFVITELEYVPRQYHGPYLKGLLRDAVAADGKLIVTQYSSDIANEPSLLNHLALMGFAVAVNTSAAWEGIKKTVVCAIEAE